MRDDQRMLGVLLIFRTIILFLDFCDQLWHNTSEGRLLQYYPLFQLYLTFYQHLHDKSISKGYNEAVNVHSATKTAAISHLKKLEIEAEVHKNSLGFWHLYTGIQKVQALQGWDMPLVWVCTEHKAMALSTLFCKKAAEFPLRP